MSFVNTKLLYSQCKPTEQVLRKYDLNNDCFTFSQRKQRIDMILEAPDKFQVLETCVCEKGLPSEPLIGIYPLRIIFWNMIEEDERDVYIWATHTEKHVEVTMSKFWIL